MEFQPKKTQRVRSPNYPNYSLKECMAFLEKLYAKYGTSEVHVDDAIKQMGHSPTSSTAGRVLASMFSFGLLESRGAKDSKFVRLSRLAQEILLDEDGSPERLNVLKQAALNDDSMQEIWNKWGANIPHEDSIKKSLQLEMNYSPEGAKRFASVIAETYDFAQLSNASSDDEEAEATEEQTSTKKQGENIGPEKASMRKANLLLQGENREIIFYAPADLTDVEFELIFKWLELQKYGLVSPVKKEKNDESKQEEKPAENHK